MIQMEKKSTVAKDILFAAKATNKDDCRRFMNGVKIEPSPVEDMQHRAIGTDGHRLHYVDFDYHRDIEPGMYEVVGKGKEIMLVPMDDAPQYPNYSRIIPDDAEVESIGRVIDISCNVGNARNEVAATYEIYSRGILANPDYIADIVSEREFEIFAHKTNPDLKALVFHNCTRHAVLMPIKK